MRQIVRHCRRGEKKRDEDMNALLPSKGENDSSFLGSTIRSRSVPDAVITELRDRLEEMEGEVRDGKIKADGRESKRE